MSKTIKFNLILDNNPIRNIDDLKNNFSIEDILDSYNNGLLKRWLGVRGYTEYLEKVNNIKADNNIDQIQELIKIFEVEYDDEKIKEGLAIIDYINERMILLDEYNKENYEARKIIDDYHQGYDSIISDIIENNDNMAKIKANVREIEENFMGLFNINYRDLYSTLIDKAPLAIFAILMNNKMRSYFISDDYSSDSTITIYGKIKEFLLNRTVLKEKLGIELKVFKGNTEAYWKDIEPKEKAFMIINMEYGNFVRNAGKFGEELANSSVNNLFLLVDGIDYKSNNANHELLYIEV